MSHRLPAFLLGFALAGQALAQVTSLNLNRIERPWPGGGPGAQALTVGSFVPNHDGRCAVVAIGGSLFYSFQPAAFEHFTAAGGSGIQRLATVPASDEAIGTLPVVWSGTDRLAVIRGDGLRLLQHGPTGFVDAAVGNAGDPSWMGATGLSARIMGTGAMRHRCVLGWSSAWVKLSVVDAAAGLLPVATFPAPAGTVVHDAALVDWVPGGATEVAVLLSNGIAVLDVNGLPVGWLQQPAAAGRLCSWRLGAAPALTVVSSTSTSGPWNVQTWQPNVLHPSSSCTLPSAPVGLVMTNVNDDAHADLLISHQGSERPFVPGSALGPVCGPSLRKILDVAPGSLPSPAAANQAPAVLDDINRDGRIDLVIASAATDEIILQLGLQTQAISALTNGDGTSSVAGQDSDMQLAFDSGLGLADLPELTPPPLPSSLPFPHPAATETDLFCVRLQLPGVSLADYPVARAVVYDLADDAGAKVQLNTARQYTYSLLPVTGTETLLSLFVPVQQATAPADYRRFAIELTLTDSSGLKSIAPLMLVCVNMFKDNQTNLALATDQLPLWVIQLSLWYYSKISVSVPFSPAGQGAVGGAPPTSGNRYVGILTPTLSAQAAAAIAALPPAVPVTGGGQTK